MAVVEEEEGREGKERGGESQGNLVTDKDQGKKIRLLEKLHLSFQCWVMAEREIFESRLQSGPWEMSISTLTCWHVIAGVVVLELYAS